MGLKYRVQFSLGAQADLREISQYLHSQGGGRAAIAYVDSIIDYCLRFEIFPARGMAHDDIRPGLRLVGYRKKATIAFRVEEDVVTIVRVFHGGRDIRFDDNDA
ncbi:type II toxin-antitoxin system RelE/ParE family toxin [Rhizobium sp. XQZ8]|uniref:type II toxin-antitoxin system RelE/ParE family toxin n=1 Tax=Rhizobium populisoli TaxID=2859785 RepID=UPI001C67B6CF|nr:type II toxin-antitoxin system RelE/ParE family toxin [Rhizobium populisoli]MBW6421154.1 type II toxin-antitoxin system RelE/ParE family toxin [Rhizobium populisoli]